MICPLRCSPLSPPLPLATTDLTLPSLNYLLLSFFVDLSHHSPVLSPPSSSLNLHLSSPRTTTLLCLLLSTNLSTLSLSLSPLCRIGISQIHRPSTTLLPAYSTLLLLPPLPALIRCLFRLTHIDGAPTASEHRWRTHSF